MVLKLDEIVAGLTDADRAILESITDETKLAVAERLATIRILETTLTQAQAVSQDQVHITDYLKQRRSKFKERPRKIFRPHPAT